MRFISIHDTPHDVMVSKASWGTISLLFVPRGHGQSRAVVMEEESQFDAERALDGMTEEELVARFEQSTPV